MNPKQRFQKLSLLLGAIALAYCPALQAQVKWTEAEENPVMGYGAAGVWDAGEVFSPSVIISGDTLKKWYTGGASASPAIPFEIGYAWSLNGVSWTRHSGNPVLSPQAGQWDSPQVAFPRVLADGDTLRMWYAGGSILSNYRTGYATSVDGIHWERHPTPVMESGPAGEWNANMMLPGDVIKEDGVFKMWVSAGVGPLSPSSSSTAYSVGYATSPDGIHWTLYDDPATTDPPFQFSDPVVLHGSPFSFDARSAVQASVIRTASGYQMWYAGNQTSRPDGAIGYATSPDGVQWTKYPGNPVLRAPDSPSAWAWEIWTPSVILDGNLYHMWFGGFDPNGGLRIGYATAPVITGVEDIHTGMPIDFALHQNYPNPFNPQTRIRYELPKSGRVLLKVFNVLGQEVRTLVDEEKSAGSYEVLWDGKDQHGLRVASGVYLYKLEAKDFAQARKMVLLQ